MAKKKSSTDKDKKYDEKRVGQRTRSWTFILYPESAPPKWQDILDEEHIAWIESPLHDKDVNATGEPKKAHYHILLMFKNIKNYEQVKEITEKLNAPIPQKCADTKALVRYMAHLDNPEKAQYDRNLIIAHGGADLTALFTPTASQRYQYIDEMSEFIRQHGIVEFEDIWEHARINRREDWFPLLCDSCSMPIKLLLSSRRHRISDCRNFTKAVEVASDETVTVNPETGEVVDEATSEEKGETSSS